MSANMYRVGDYVFFETSATAPYQIRRIEELNKTQNGNVEAKVMCFFRRRDISNTLIMLADKHHKVDDGCASEDGDSNHKVSPRASPNTTAASTTAANTTTTTSSSSSPSSTTATATTTTATPAAKEGSEENGSDHPPVNGNNNNNGSSGDGDNSSSSTTTTTTTTTTTPAATATVNGPCNGVKAEGGGEEKPAAPVPVVAADEIPDKFKHQLNHRELFLSRQVETLPATHIRGKCCVTLLNETESRVSYLNKDDTFFYSLVYDPQQKTLLADKGEIRVGSKYQAEMIPKTQGAAEDTRKSEDLEQLVWDPVNGLADKEVDQFQIIARSVGTFARALDCTSTVRQPSLHMSAAAASRDITIFHAMDTLHRHSYDLAKAIKSLVPSGGPVLCRDEMEEWSASEANLFEDALEKYGKDFNDIKQDFLPWKSLKSIVEYYYMWKTTDRYVQQKRIKASEAESKLKQVYIPNYNKPNPAAITTKLNGPEGGPISGRACESCYISHSSQWYSWGPVHMQCRLCANCWAYWKKYGGLKMPTRLDGERPAPNQRQERIAQMNSIRMQKCSIPGCGKEFKLKAHLARHLATAHGLTIQPGSPRPVMKTRAAFCLVTTELTRISRRLCSDILRSRHAARCPFTPINTSIIKQECQLRLTERGNVYQPVSKTRTPQTLDPVVARLGIDIKMATPNLLRRGAAYTSDGERSATPKERPQESMKLNNVGHPSIMKKRGYEQTNGVDSGPQAKRPNMGVIRQAGQAAKTPGVTRGSVLNHNSVNGRNRFSAPKGVRLHMVSWMDMPDDVYFVATAATRKLRKQLQLNDFKRLARNPWKRLNVKPPLPSGTGIVPPPIRAEGTGSNGHSGDVVTNSQQEVVVLD